MAKGSSKNGWILLLMILVGIVIGGFLGALLGSYVPILKFGYNLGVSPHTWDLNILKLTFGFSLNINMFSILGIAIGIYIYKKM